MGTEGGRSFPGSAAMLVVLLLVVAGAAATVAYLAGRAEATDEPRADAVPAIVAAPAAPDAGPATELAAVGGAPSGKGQVPPAAPVGKKAGADAAADGEAPAASPPPKPPLEAVAPGSVRDAATGRVWGEPSPRALPWEEAREWCAARRPQGRWRLPYRAEIESMFDGERLRKPFVEPLRSAGFVFSGEGVPGREPGHVWVANLANGHVFNGYGRTVHVLCIDALADEEETRLSATERAAWESGLPVLADDRLVVGDSWTAGPESAPVTVFLFADLACPFSRRTMASVPRLREAYGDRVRVVLKSFPIAERHAYSERLWRAVYAAGQQGRFWEMCERLVGARVGPTDDTVDRVLSEAAGGLGLDRVRFVEDTDSDAARRWVQRQLEHARRAGVTAVPTTFVNGRRHVGLLELDELRALIDAASAP